MESNKTNTPSFTPVTVHRLSKVFIFNKQGAGAMGTPDLDKTIIV